MSGVATYLAGMTNVSDVIIAGATLALAVLTYYVRKATQLQFVAAMTAAFQNEWHNERSTLMRDYLHSEKFEDVLNAAIQDAYGKKIPYQEIKRLLDRSELINSDDDKNRLRQFESRLRASMYSDPVNPNKNLFSAYQAVYEVLLSFDRLAIVRDDSLMMEKCTRRYRPPIRDLAPVLQAFIAVRIILRPPHLKNYKKDYMHLLALLDVEDLALLEKCRDGLIERGELTGKERRNWASILKKHARQRRQPTPWTEIFSG